MDMYVILVVLVALRFNLMISANHSADVSQTVVGKHQLITRFNTFYSA